MDRKAFYDSIRPHLNLTTENVAGTEFLLGKIEAAAIPVNYVADMLASTWWETGQRMQPIDEYGSDAYFNARYGPQTKVGKVLGNTQPGDGARFHGRGYQQDTGRRNYQFAKDKLGIDFVGHPELMKVPENAWLVMYHGMMEGWFTGRKLSDYIDLIDEPDSEDFKEYVAARKVINGTDKAETIANLALIFEHGLKDAGYAPGAPAQPVPPLPAPPQPPAPPTPPVTPPVAPVAPKSWYAPVVAFLKLLFSVFFKTKG